jgi:hypothetical protein
MVLRIMPFRTHPRQFMHPHAEAYRFTRVQESLQWRFEIGVVLERTKEQVQDTGERCRICALG